MVLGQICVVMISIIFPVLIEKCFNFIRVLSIILIKCLMILKWIFVRCGAVVGAVKFSAEKARTFQTPATMAAMVANVHLFLNPADLRL